MSKGSRQRPTAVPESVVASNWANIFKKPDPRNVEEATLEDEEFNRIDEMQVRVKDNGDDFGKCGCGRSPTGKCIGWHGLSEEAFKARLAEYIEQKAASDK